MAYNQAVYKIFCPNCSKIIYGYKKEETGMTLYSCSRCGYSKTSKKCGRNAFDTKEYYPRGGSIYAEEEDFVPEEDDDLVI